MRKILLMMLLLLAFASILLAEEININKNNVGNYISKLAKLNNIPNYIVENRISHNEEFKLNTLSYIDSLIVNEKQLKYETAEGTVFNPIIHMFMGDARILEIYYRLILFGDDFSKKIAIDGITYWWDVPNDDDHLWLKGGEYVIIDIDSAYIMQMKILLTFELNKLLYHPSTALHVSAATTLVKLGCNNKKAIDILKRCSISENSVNWDLTDTVIYKTIKLKSYYRKGKNESDRRIDAINEIIKKANEGLNLFNQSKDPLNEAE
ncbi:MAG: hypothetical protein KAS49_05070 [Candidatus Cloacimonetes bacterium]|nr:hypothetical protein [Candidatus Cloacimonadota bacterium]